MPKLVSLCGDGIHRPKRQRVGASISAYNKINPMATLTADELVTSTEEKVEHLTLAVTLMEREQKDDGYRIGLDELASRYNVPELK
jgi:hypothetical protein